MPLYTCTEGCNRQGPRDQCAALVMSHPGRVFATYRHAWIDDDDYYALAWDDDTHEIVSHLIGTTRFAPNRHTGATVDADTNEYVMSAVTAYFTSKYAELIRRSAETDITEGDRVASTTTRGKNKGFAGEVTHIVRSKFGYDAWRVRVSTDDGEARWLSLDKVARPVTEDDLDAAARRLMKNNGWEALMRGTVRM